MFETEPDYELFLKFTDIFEYSKTFEILGNVWQMGDFKVKLGVLHISSIGKLIILQVEYEALCTSKSTEFIKEFIKQLLTDFSIGETTQLKTQLPGFYNNEKDENQMFPHQRLSQFCVPLIEDDI